MRAVTFPLATALILGWTSAVAAEERTPPDSERARELRRTEFELSVLGAFGAGGRFEDNAVNRYGLGLGVRAGVTLGVSGLYFGGSFVRFLGGEDQSGRFYTSTLDAEVGYEFRLLQELLAVRPQLALGVAQPVTIQFDSAGYLLGFHWAPGLVVSLKLRPFLASAEVRADVVPDQWSNAATFMLGCGIVL